MVSIKSEGFFKWEFFLKKNIVDVQGLYPISNDLWP